MRWPFAVALVAVLAGVGGMLATPHIKTRWQAWEDARQERQWAAEFKQEQPAADALAQMPLPDGVQNCPGLTGDSIAKTHRVCWRGAAEVEPATIALATNLRAIGAENVSPRCLHKGSATSALRMTMCDLRAEIEGRTLFMSIGPQIEKIGDRYDLHGVAVDGGIDALESLFPVVGVRGTPLPVPGE